LGTRNHGESSRRAVKADAGRAFQIRSEDSDSRSHLAGTGYWLYKRAQSHGQTKNRAAVVSPAAIIAGPAVFRRPIEIAIRGLNQAIVRGRTARVLAVTAKSMQGGQGATGSNVEHCAPVKIRCPVKVSVGALNQRRNKESTVGTVGLSTKLVKHRQGSSGGDFEHCATTDVAGLAAVASPATVVRCRVKFPVRALNQTCEGLLGKLQHLKGGQRASGRDFENRAVVIAIPARDRCPVEIPVCTLNQRTKWSGTIGTARLLSKVVKGCKRTSGSDLKNCTLGAVVCLYPTRVGCSVEIAIGGLNEACGGLATVGAARLRAKAVKRSERTTWSNFKDSATTIVIVSEAVCAGILCGPIEVPVSAQNQARNGLRAVRAIRFGTKAVEGGKRAACRDLKDRATAGKNRRTTSMVSAELRGAVEVSVASLHERHTIWVSTIASVETDQCGQSLRGRENRRDEAEYKES